MSTNGEYVTRAELAGQLRPIQDDISDISRDVKTLLLAQAGSVAVLKYRRWLIATAFALMSIVIAAGSTLAALYL